jgi:hypothetical protein
MAVEVGRPGAGARLRELKTIAIALAEKGIFFEPMNPVTFLFEDVKTGRLFSGSDLCDQYSSDSRHGSLFRRPINQVSKNWRSYKSILFWLSL